MYDSPPQSWKTARIAAQASVCYSEPKHGCPNPMKGLVSEMFYVVVGHSPHWVLSGEQASGGVCEAESEARPNVLELRVQS